MRRARIGRMDTLPRFIIAADNIHDAVDAFVEVYGQAEAGQVELPSGAMLWYGVESVQIGDVPIYLNPIVDIVGDVPPERWGQVTATRLNVRSGPGTEHQVIHQIVHTAVVRILDEADGWYQVVIDMDGGAGWAAAEWILELEPDA